MPPDHKVVFVCPHGAAKSVIAATYFQRLAERRGLPVAAAAAGTDPDPEVSPQAAAGLLAEGIDVRGYRPRRVTREELVTARRVVSLGCEPGELLAPGVTVDRWDDVPPVSEGFGAASAAIARRVERLVDEVAQAAG